ncbi:MAG TPA: DUF2141 domain-containing protein [Paucimonas sp.]|nr:DUF2141 domain-containing protein [Paucimonas sp.]
MKFLSTLPRYVALAVTAMFGCAAQAADLAVTVENVKDNDGQVMIGLFDSADAFPKKVLRGQKVEAGQRDANGRIRVVFAGIPAGSYAVSVVHDRDGNGRLTMNMIGIPAEPYGFSGAGGGFGPPQFKDAAVSLSEAGAAISIQVK